MTISTRHVTIAEYEALPEPSDGTRYELVNGEVITVTGSGLEHGLIVGAVYDAIRDAVRGTRLGYVLGDGTGFILSDDPPTVRVPDVAFIARDRIPVGFTFRGFAPGPPDLAVEVVSPWDRAADVRAKVGQYLVAGTRLVWVLWPDEGVVTVYRTTAAGDSLITEVGTTGTLDGGDVLPGFSVPVSVLFEIEL